MEGIREALSPQARLREILWLGFSFAPEKAAHSSGALPLHWFCCPDPALSLLVPGLVHLLLDPRFASNFSLLLPSYMVPLLLVPGLVPLLLVPVLSLLVSIQHP